MTRSEVRSLPRAQSLNFIGRDDELIIGVDLDGVLTRIALYNTNTKLPWWCGLLLILVPPNKKIIKRLRKHFKDGEGIIIVSARHKQLENMTRCWLKIYKIPFTRLVLVGPGNNVADKKLAAIRVFGIETFIDDDIRTVNFLKNADVNAVHCKGAFLGR